MKSVIDYSDAVLSGKALCLCSASSFQMGVVCWYANPPNVGGKSLVISVHGHLGSWTFASESLRPYLNKYVFRFYGASNKRQLMEHGMQTSETVSYCI